MPAGALGREIAGRIRITGRIRYPPGAPIHPVTRIRPVNLPARAADGAGGNGVTRVGKAGCCREGSEPDRRLDDQAARLARVFTCGTPPFPAGGDPRSRLRPAESHQRPHQSRSDGLSNHRGPLHPSQGVERPTMTGRPGQAVTRGGSYGSEPDRRFIASWRDPLTFSHSASRPFPRVPVHDNEFC